MMWKYEDYSEWSRQMARTMPMEQIMREIGRLDAAQDKAKASHLLAVQRTTSMTSNSQRRAQSRSVVTGNYERMQALKSAVEIHASSPWECNTSTSKRDKYGPNGEKI